jgi:hypothetical protein
MPFASDCSPESDSKPIDEETSQKKFDLWADLGADWGCTPEEALQLVREQFCADFYGSRYILN